MTSKVNKQVNKLPLLPIRKKIKGSLHQFNLSDPGVISIVYLPSVGATEQWHIETLRVLYQL